ncbi:molybdenum cofactor sulfurase 3 [Condylostylus longicornis]|uniref:molybdenum cofactor sulfurase 3 n=1 Tax=Condylostylus longicornis TaxID=2530218 RepID=UPI00244E249E|nr:molybdenum cofactor sulfurase 3 [Condylostylus longicornis]
MTELVNEFSEKEISRIKEEFKRIDDKIYVDHAGTALYSEKQIDCVSKLLKDNIFCNPHTCKITGDLVDQVRFRILSFFNTNSEKYTIVFTANASAALKTVAECFDFGTSGSFHYCQENHTSVLGMREVVQTKNVSVLTRSDILKNISSNRRKNCDFKKFSGNSLLAFSAQCNLSGYKMPLDVIESIQNKGIIDHGKYIRGELDHTSENKCFICLDAASFAATNFLDLKKYSPDFVCISFYKIFGYPTGLGALLLSKRGQSVMKKKYFGGGTVKISMTCKDFHVKRDNFAEQYEDGTLSFLSIASLLEGFKTLERLVPSTNDLRSQQRISRHVFNLAKYFYESLNDLRHENGQKLIEFYNHTNYESSETQGGIVCFNILHEDGSYVGFAEVACIAAVYNIILRTGCFCNAGACQSFLKLRDEDIVKHFQAGHVCSDYNDLIEGQPTGGVRISFGYITQKSDVDAVLQMLKNCYVSETSQKRLEIIKSKDLPKALRHIPERLSRVKAQLTKICIYPIKSCAAFEINGETQWEITENGLKYDRIWMIVDSNGMAFTQKRCTQLCLIKPRINLKSNHLELSFKEKVSTPIPLQVSVDETNTITTNFCQSKVCGDSIQGFDCGNEIAAWLSDVLSTPGLRLIRQNDNSERKYSDGTSKEINLSNQAQYLLINKSSVAWLLKRIPNWQKNMNSLDDVVKRFRANLIIENCCAFEENNIKNLQIGDIDFNIEGPCTRCQMICIDQNTGDKTAEPLKTIAKEFQGKIKFGIYLSQKILDEGPANKSISCNDKVTLAKN